MAQNPRTLERVPVPARRTVKFKIGRLMKEAVEKSANSQHEMPIVETTAKDRVTVSA